VNERSILFLTAHVMIQTENKMRNLMFAGLFMAFCRMKYVYLQEINKINN
jgi:hypothetical protein